MLRLFIKYNHSGHIHEYGTNCHDSLILQDDGSLHYYNLQCGDGTLSPGGGYSFCAEDGTVPEYDTEHGVEPFLDIGGCIPHENYKQRIELYDILKAHYGGEKQSIVAIEELSECQKEICKFLRGNGNIDHLAEEVADAAIMLEQITQIYGIKDNVMQYMDGKCKRTFDRLLRESIEKGVELWHNVRG